MGKSGSQKVKTTATPWAPQGTALQDVFKNAKDVYNAGKNPNADLTSGWNMARANVTDPNSGYGQAKNYWSNVLANGGYDDNVFKNIASHVIPGVTSQFMGSGRTGSGLEGINLTDQLTQSFSPFAIGQANMAANNLPMLDMNAAQSLTDIGNQQAQFPWQNMGNYYNIIGGNNWGGNTTSKTSGGGPGIGQQIGGAALGILGGALKGGIMGGPVGAFMGGIGGGASSFFNPTNIGGVY